ncbi:hypothetical protein U9M48_000350 [Paspalum notatum var. saurae]|uniref:Uncharacterized protein n=1 Tax=Paspalum notatum var. saurae TaxID=547442 RepID=A0AAQ3PGQ8_PASNO
MLQVSGGARSGRGGGVQREPGGRVQRGDGGDAARVRGGFAAEGRGRRCPTLGCAMDLAAECPPSARSPRGGCGAGAAAAALFKARCPDTRTNATDVEATPQDCVAPREIEVVFCPAPDAVAGHHY